MELLELPTWQRAAAGLFLSLQYPVEIPGVRVEDLLDAAGDGVRRTGLGARVRAEATRLAVADEFLERGVNIEFSGGEQKRAETLQLALLKPKFAILDELDSGLDVDALRDVSRRIEAMTEEDGLGVLAITHYARLLTELRPDVVHVFMAGRVITSGGPELADELERTGYDGLAERLGIELHARRRTGRGRRPLRRPRLLTSSPFSARDAGRCLACRVRGRCGVRGRRRRSARRWAVGGRRDRWAAVARPAARSAPSWWPGAIGVLEMICAGVPPNT